MADLMDDRTIEVIIIQSGIVNIHERSLEGCAGSILAGVCDRRKLGVIEWRLIEEPAVSRAAKIVIIAATIVVEANRGGDGYFGRNLDNVW